MCESFKIDCIEETSTHARKCENIFSENGISKILTRISSKENM